MNTFVTTSLLIYFVCWSQKFVSSNPNPIHNPTSASTNPQNSQTTPVELDIKKKAGTNEFDYSKNDKIGTYTAKQGYAFSKVYQKKGSCNCCGSDTIIWEADSESEYSSKVVVDGVDSNTKTVTIELPNNKTRTFNKPGLGKSWSETIPPNQDSNNQSSPTTPNLTGSTGASSHAAPESDSSATPESDGSSVSEDQSSKQSGTGPQPSSPETVEQDKTETSTDGDGSQSADSSTPAEGTTPPAPKSGGTEGGATKTGSDGSQSGDGSTPTTPNGGSSQSANGGTPTTPSDNTQSNGGSSDSDNNFIDLDLDNKESTDQVEYSNDNNVEIYTAKNFLLFKKVTRGTNKVWETENDKYADKVTVFKNAKSESTVRLDYPAVTATPKLTNGFILDIADIPSQDVDKTEYKCKKYGGTYDYDMKKGYQCTEVKFKGEIVWKHKSGEYPVTVVYESEKHFIIHFSGDFFDFKKNKEDKWERTAKHFDCVKDNVGNTPGNNQSDGQGTPATPDGGSTVTTPSADGSQSASTPATPNGGSAQS